MSERQEIAQERSADVAEFRLFREKLVKHFGLKPRALATVSYGLVRHARMLKLIYERECSVERTDAEIARDERNETIAMREAQVLVSKYLPGASIDTQGDPRGFAIKLHFPNDAEWNTWGGRETGYGVPEVARLR